MQNGTVWKNRGKSCIMAGKRKGGPKMNLKQRLAVCAGALLGAGVLSVLICPLHLPAGKVCLAASLWAACAASAGPWAADARAKSRLVRVGAAAICTGYGLLDVYKRQY